jgi:hypothetical protein
MELNLQCPSCGIQLQVNSSLLRWSHGCIPGGVPMNVVPDFDVSLYDCGSFQIRVVPSWR